MSNELIFVVTLLLVYHSALCSSPDSAKGQLCFPTLTFHAGTVKEDMLGSHGCPD